MKMLPLKRKKRINLKFQPKIPHKIMNSKMKMQKPEKLGSPKRSLNKR
jgi:hypothetical protein